MKTYDTTKVTHTTDELMQLHKPTDKSNMIDFSIRHHAYSLLKRQLDSNEGIIDRYDTEGWYNLPRLLKEYKECAEEYEFADSCPKMYDVLDWKHDTEYALEALREWTQYGRAIMIGKVVANPTVWVIGDFTDDILSDQFYRTIATVMMYLTHVDPRKECRNSTCPICMLESDC